MSYTTKKRGRPRKEKQYEDNYISIEEHERQININLEMINKLKAENERLKKGDVVAAMGVKKLSRSALQYESLCLNVTKRLKYLKTIISDDERFFQKLFEDVNKLANNEEDDDTQLDGLVINHFSA